MTDMAAGRAIVEALRAEGVEYVFRLVGTTTNSIVTELYGRDDIKFIDARHEEDAAFMYYGYARAPGYRAESRVEVGPGRPRVVGPASRERRRLLGTVTAQVILVE